MASASVVFVWSSSLLIRRHYRASCQAEIPLIAPSEIVEPLLRSRDGDPTDRLRGPDAMTSGSAVARCTTLHIACLRNSLTLARCLHKVHHALSADLR